eukprot:g16760.t1
MKSAGSCRESMNESRSSVEAMFQSKLGESGRLERRSCVDVLQSLGLTFQEANTLLKERQAEKRPADDGGHDF